MKKIIIIMTLFFIGILNINSLELYSNNVILYNLDEDKILYEKNSNEQVEIASMTKIVTVLVALENVDNIKDKITLTEEVFYGLLEQDASVADFYVNEVVTIEDLLYGAMLPSGADATRALALNISGSESEFVKLMNDKVKELNLKNTVFKNTSGLDEDNQYSSVYDLSRILIYALDNPEFKKIFETEEYTTSNGRLDFVSTTISISKKYDINLPYIIGSKTGWTDKAGVCLASIAKNNANLLLVTSRAMVDEYYPYNLEDAKTVYDYYFNNYGYQIIISKDEEILKFPTKYSSKKEISITLDKDIPYYLKNDYDEDLIYFNYNGIETLSSKNKIGDRLGTLEIYYEDELIETVDIILNEKINFSIINFLFVNYYLVIIVLFLLLLIFILKTKRNTK